MASLLVLSSNNAQNPLTLDLSGYIDVTPGNGLDPADPAFTQRVWSRSLLKEGATLALEQLVEREMQFPLKIGPVGGLAGAPTSLTASLKLVQQINQVLETPGATMTWQPPGASQPTTFDVLSGLVEPQYNYRAEQQFWEIANLRVFTQPLGRTASPRAYATASGVGPLLMISPYASSGALTIAASTQAGVAGFGGQPQGANSGVFYWGQPSLAGDAPAQLQISYAGPIPSGAQFPAGITPFTAISVLPDKEYQPLIPRTAWTVGLDAGGSVHSQNDALAVASTFTAFAPSTGGNLNVQIGGLSGQPSPLPLSWQGQHRLLAIARASVQPGRLYTIPNSVVPYSTSATVYPGDWGLWDLGVFNVRASEAPADFVTTKVISGQSCFLDVTAAIMLPDNATWFMNPITPGQAAASAAFFGTPGLNSNLIGVDDTVTDQFILTGGSVTSAPSLAFAYQFDWPRSVAPYSRGLVPQPDPKNGMPIIAIVGVAQQYVSVNGQGASAAWTNPQNLHSSAQVNILERTRYTLP